ncbi:MAG TPA: Hsp20/alpha crystallin family protein [Pyrinomonadaceae bacterium]|jgi:HSP20 family protein|nr:Hsp20/alpha crystallin family protein [Pyrinomonadaceae bacterium]
MAKQNNTRTKQTSSKDLQKRDELTEIGTRLAATPFEFMRRFGEEMDKLVGDFDFGRGWLPPALARGAGAGLWVPEIEMFEQNGELIVRADLPGLTKDDVNIEIDNDAITIEGERRSEQKENREGFYRTERSYGKFYRRLPLPDGVEAENANATFRDGVLEITMDAPKRVESKPRKVAISDTSAGKAHRKAA